MLRADSPSMPARQFKAQRYTKRVPGIAADGVVKPPATLPQVPPDIATLLIERHNTIRYQHGLHLLSKDSKATEVALARAYEIRDRGISHDWQPNGILDVVEQWNYYQYGPYRQIGENLARMGGQNSEDGSPWYERLMWLWLNSPTHRENILFPDFSVMGVGITEQDGAWWIAVTFKD